MALLPKYVTVAVSRVDGGVTILKIKQYGDIPVDAARVDATIAKRVDSGVWGGEKAPWKMPTSWRFVPDDYVDQNTDKYFRNAWKDAPGLPKPDVDMPKARNIHRDAMRRARTPLLDALDVDYSKADENGDNVEKSRIAGQKRLFRDITATTAIEDAQSPNELKAFWPPILGENKALSHTDNLRRHEQEQLAKLKG